MKKRIEIDWRGKSAIGDFIYHTKHVLLKINHFMVNVLYLTFLACLRHMTIVFRHGMLSVAGKKRDSLKLTRRLFTDNVIALSGKHSIMKKSLVIYDDHGPVARGERMACSM